MPVKSMTGFGRATGQDGDAAWSWEIRTVNNRGLDVRLRLPAGLEGLEPRLREALGKQIKRGSCTVGLALNAPAMTSAFRLNESLLLRLAEIAERARSLTGRSKPVPLAALLGMKGVIEFAEAPPAEAAPSPLAEALFASFQRALSEAVAVRQAEGERLCALLLEKLDEIESLSREAERSPERGPEAIAERLRLQIRRLLSESTGFDEVRLHQEAVLIATKADIEEELQRLYAHVAAARELLEEGAPIGRRLEFLAQEFQREANTLCAKANAPELTRIGLRLKTAIDQIREQVQNVE
jgi:uncharacterized protein (TIGR00255 family)